MSEGHRTDPDHGHSPGNRCENRDSCDKRICDKDRRRLLGALAAGGSLSLAGCTGVFASPESSQSDESETRFDVEYTAQNETIVEVAADQTVLGAGEDAGLELPFDCRAGFCGTCLAKANGDASELVRMVVNDVDLLNEEAVKEGYFLPCTSQPRNHFKMDTSVGAGDLLEYQEDTDEGEDADDGEDSTDGEDDETGGGTQTVHTVTYTNEQWSIEVPEDQNLLEAGEARGLELPFQCRVGRCGQCLAQIDGDATELVELTANDYGPLDDEARADGYTLTCTGQPRGDFELESGKYGELDG